jgi:cytosine/adenosine deaminase-related metal-dependent hydrolase
MSSVELLLPLAMTLVEDGLLDLPTLLARLSSGPASLRLPAGKLAVGSAADLVLFDPASSTVAGEHGCPKATTAHSSAIACRRRALHAGGWTDQLRRLSAALKWARSKM